MTAARSRFTAGEIKQAARGRELEMLTSLAGIPSELLDESREHPCPKCGGNTRFRLIDREAGAVHCSHCFNQGNGDWLAAVKHFRGWTFPQTLDEAAAHLGLAPLAAVNSNGHHKGNGHTSQRVKPKGVDWLQRMADDKHCPVESLVAYGGVVNGIAVEFPLYGVNSRCSTFYVYPGSNIASERKGENATGKSAGLFLPHDSNGKPKFPKPGDIVVLVEGVKDAAVLHSFGYFVIGLPGKYLKTEWLPLFRGVRVVLCLDNDEAGIEATAKLAKKLKGIAS